MPVCWKWPKFGILLLILSLLAGPAMAKDETPSPPDELTIDQRCEAALAAHTESSLPRVALTKLLSEAFTPLMKVVHQQILAVPDKEITAIATQVPQSFRKGFVSTYDNDKELGFDAQYNLETIENNNFDEDVPFTSWNQTPMHRLALATIVTSKLIKKMKVNEDPTILQSTNLLKRHTFSKTNIEETFYFALLSVRQAAAQLTAEPIAGAKDADALLHEVMAQTDALPSLMVMYSLMLRPELLGRYGSRVYVQEAVMRNERGRPTFTPKFKDFLKRQRDRFMGEAGKAPHEMGHGCPVAHCSGPDQERPGLQYFLDAVMYVYDRI